MKKRKKEEKPSLSPSQDFTQDAAFRQLATLYSLIKEKYHPTTTDLLKVLETKDILIPVTIFTPQLSALETITKFLRENLQLSFKDCAQLLNRSEKTLWQSYTAARRKHPQPFTLTESKHYIPLSLIASRKLSVLESIVSYLKDSYQLTYHEIAVLLHRNDRTVWTVYQRALKKQQGGAA